MIKNCYIRVDANSTIGTGHLVRTEILADELKKNNINITFICNTIPKNYKTQLLKKNYTVFTISPIKNEYNTISSIITLPNSLLIIDSDNPEFYTSEFQTSIRQRNIKLMMITFFHQHHFFADIILNQNIMALSQTYSCEPHTIQLLGPQYVILKKEYQKIFNNLQNNKIHLPNKTILLTFGGIDKPDRTRFIYQALLDSKNKIDKIIIVLGSMYQNKKDIEQLAKNSKIKTDIYQNTPQMPYLLAESDIVFNSGGLTVWEAGVFNNLIVIMGHTKREQTGGKFIGDNQYGIYLGTKDDYTPTSLAKTIDTILQTDYTPFITNLSKQIDVNGIEKVINAIKSL